MRAIGITAAAIIVLAISTSCGFLFPVTKTTYVGHSLEDALAAVDGRQVQHAQVLVSDRTQEITAVHLDLRSGEKWTVSADRAADILLKAIDAFNADVPKELRIEVERTTSYG